MKPLLSEKTTTDNITLVENNVMVSKDKEVAGIFNSFFSNAVKNLNLDSYAHFSFDEYFLCRETQNEDPVLRAIEKYENHPSILKIKQNTSKRSCFSFKQTNLKSVTEDVTNLDESKATLFLRKY